jgi:DNA-binding MarR family transcriptional regulator
MPNPKKIWKRQENIIKFLDLLMKKKELTFPMLKDKLQVSVATLSAYIKALEQQGKIESFIKSGEDRRVTWYRIKPENAKIVETQLSRYEAVKFIEGLSNPVHIRKSQNGTSVDIFISFPMEVGNGVMRKLAEASTMTIAKANLSQAAEKFLKLLSTTTTVSKMANQKIAIVIMSE